jgi:integrase
MSNNPTWSELFAKRIETEVQNGAPRRKATAATNQITETAKVILGREPTAEDVSQELVEFVVHSLARKLTATGNRWAAIRRRVEHIEYLAGYVTKFPNCKRVDCSELLEIPKIAWPMKFRDQGISTEVFPIPKAEESPGFDGAVIQMPLQVLFDDHYAPDRLLGKSDNTSRLYNNTIRKFSRHLCRTPVIGDLNHKTVIHWLRFQLTHTDLRRATIEKDRHLLCALWRYCSRKRWAGAEPEIQKIEVPDRIPDVWTDEDMGAIIRACQQATGRIGEAEACLWWEALVRTIADSAERIGAILQVQWDDLNRDGWLTVRAEYRKRKSRDRPYTLRPETIEKLAELRQSSGATKEIFHWPYNYNYVWKRYKRILKAAGLSTGRRDQFHKIRRSTASAFEAAGGNATELLDHSDRKTTVQYYIDPKTQRHVQPADILPGIGQKVAEAAESGDDSDLLEAIRKLVEDHRKPR